MTGDSIITDSAIAPQCFVRPQSFAGLMTLYESNFIRLYALVPDLDRLNGEAVSIVSADCDLHLTVEERTRYTTTIHLTYYFAAPSGPQADPDLRIRIYRDARLAEAMACTRRHRHAALSRFEAQQARELPRRWSRNMLLNKWLEYCVDRGHAFAAAR
ncbi:MAG: DUF1249 domain-containing protein [Gammaproteobacteria bacterium]